MQKQKVSILSRIQAPETPPGWSLMMALFFLAAFVVLWIAGQIVGVTLSGDLLTAPGAGTLAFGALLGCVVTSFGIVQWAQRRVQGGWLAALRLFQPPDPPVFLVVLVGLGAAWTIDLAGIVLKAKGDQLVPPILAALVGPIGPSWVAAALLAIVVEPLAEGLVFAGILYPVVAQEVKNNVLASVIVAAVYTIVTLTILAGGASPWYVVIQPFLMALVMLLVRAYSQSTQSAIVARALFGLFFVLSALIGMRF